MKYGVRVSTRTVLRLRPGCSTLSTNDQSVTGVVTTSPFSHKPGRAIMWWARSWFKSRYSGSRPVSRSVKSVAARITTTSTNPTFNGFIFPLLLSQVAERDATPRIACLRSVRFSAGVRFRIPYYVAGCLSKAQLDLFHRTGVHFVEELKLRNSSASARESCKGGTNGIEKA